MIGATEHLLASFYIASYKERVLTGNPEKIMCWNVQRLWYCHQENPSI